MMPETTTNTNKEKVENSGFFKDYWLGIVGTGVAFSAVIAFQTISAGKTSELVPATIGGFGAGIIIGFIWNIISYGWGRATGKIPPKTKNKESSKFDWKDWKQNLIGILIFFVIVAVVAIIFHLFL